jgi:hypothetical protein
MVSSCSLAVVYMTVFALFIRYLQERFNVAILIKSLQKYLMNAHERNLP